MKKIIGGVLLAALCVLGCDDEKAEAPAAAPGTMIVKLNGASLSPSTTLAPRAELAGNGLVVQAWFLTGGAGGEEAMVNLFLINAAVGRFELRGDGSFATDPPGSATYNILGKKVYKSWAVDETIVGNITITKLDENNELASGTFELKLKDANSSEVIELKEGSFTDLPLF